MVNRPADSNVVLHRRFQAQLRLAQIGLTSDVDYYVDSNPQYRFRP